MENHFIKIKKNKSLRKDDITRNTSLKDGLCYTGSMEWGYIAWAEVPKS